MQNLRFVKDDSAATTIEYSLIAAGISFAFIVSEIGTSLNGKFNSVSTQLRWWITSANCSASLDGVTCNPGCELREE